MLFQRPPFSAPNPIYIARPAHLAPLCVGRQLHVWRVPPLEPQSASLSMPMSHVLGIVSALSASYIPVACRNTGFAT